LGLTWKAKNRRRSAQLLFKSGQIDRYWSFMASPEPECTCTEPEKRQEKRQVWPNGDSSPGGAISAGKVTDEGRFAIRSEPDIIQT
jgi:hypothetical protein